MEEAEGADDFRDVAVMHFARNGKKAMQADRKRAGHGAERGALKLPILPAESIAWIRYV